MSSKCIGCLSTSKKTENEYCKKCITTLFDGITPKPLGFDKKEFYIKRAELSNRMSLSGMQDKISLHFDGNHLVPVATNGKYILKPIPRNAENFINVDDIVANEHLSMQISKQVFKINTAESGLIRFADGELAYITKRFDYLENETKYDQEDFASILQVTSSTHGKDYKYNAKTYTDCMRAIKEYSPTSILNVSDFFNRIVFNYLIANGDAHLKNFSLYSISTKRDFMLTPNYDVLNTRMHIKNEFGDIAMELFDEETKEFQAIGFYTYADFRKLANYFGISKKILDYSLSAFSKQKSNVIKLIDNSLLSSDGKKLYKETYIDRLTKRLEYKIL